MNPLYLIDFYKAGHINQYPADTTQIWSNFTPRSTWVKGQDKVVFFGLQYFIKEILIAEWNEQFFSRDINEIVAEYKQFIQATLGVAEPRTDHIVALHGLGYLPLAIYSLPEGTSVRFKTPMLVITNTHASFFWLPNYFETILSNILWKPCTSATTAQSYRKIFTKWAKLSGERDLGFIDWQGHDFSFRGTSGREDAILSGMGHLLSFSGTDTVPAIWAAHKYYGAPLTVGGSVPATEHSVMCSGGQDNELETFRHLIEDVYPTGVVSIVSDTWDLWKVLTEYIPALKEKILARQPANEYVPAKVVIRPDSGDPVHILCGEPWTAYPDKPEGPQNKGTLRLLAEAMGVDSNREGLPLINKAGAIYGDSITLERAEKILERTVTELQLSPYNVVFGIGSYTYEYVTRDTYGFAMKATAVRRGTEIHDIFKKPVTDKGDKISHKGIPAVYRTEESTEEKPEYFVVQGATPLQLHHCAFQLSFINGELNVEETFETIRKRVRA